MNRPITSGRWTVVGHLALSEQEANEIHFFFRQDALTDRLTRYWTDPTSNQNHESPISFEEAAELECAAVWSDVHVEERLAAHCLGRTSTALELLRPRPQ